MLKAGLGFVPGMAQGGEELVFVVGEIGGRGLSGEQFDKGSVAGKSVARLVFKSGESLVFDVQLGLVIVVNLLSGSGGVFAEFGRAHGFGLKLEFAVAFADFDSVERLFLAVFPGVLDSSLALSVALEGGGLGGGNFDGEILQSFGQAGFVVGGGVFLVLSQELELGLVFFFENTRRWTRERMASRRADRVSSVWLAESGLLTVAPDF